MNLVPLILVSTGTVFHTTQGELYFTNDVKEATLVNDAPHVFIPEHTTIILHVSKCKEGWTVHVEGKDMVYSACSLCGLSEMGVTIVSNNEFVTKLQCSDCNDMCEV